MSSESDAFGSAEYYDCRDVDELTHASPEEAIEAYLDDHWEPGRSMAAVIETQCPVTVTAWDRCEIGDTWIDVTARHLIDYAEEWLCQEFGGPRHEAEIDEASRKSAVTAMKNVVARLVECATWHGCERAAERAYDAEQVTAMIREQHPEWFEKGASGV